MPEGEKEKRDRFDIWEEDKARWQRQLEESQKAEPAPVKPVGVLGMKFQEPIAKSWIPFVSTFKEIASWFSGERTPFGTPFQSLERTTEAQRQQAEQSVTDSLRAQFMIDLYDTLPIVTIGTKNREPIRSFRDYVTVMGIDPKYLTQEDIAEADKAISSYIPEEGELPEWLEVEPEVEEKVREFLTAKPTLPPPTGISRLTINALVTQLTAVPVVKPPEDMTVEEVLGYASVMDIPPEDVANVLDIDTAMSVIREAAQEREQMVDDVLAGIREWEMPEQSFWDKAFFMVQSPMQQFAEFIRPYLEHFVYPLSGQVGLWGAKMVGNYEAEREYNELKAGGLDGWHAAGQMWEESDIPWYFKLGLEIIIDPITWIPGWGLSKPGALLTKIGLTRLGTKMISLNKAMYSVLDVPFDIWKFYQTKGMARSFAQQIANQSDLFLMTFNKAVNKQTGKAMHQFTPTDVALTLQKSREAFLKAPDMVGDVFVDLGKYLSNHVAMTGKQAHQWSRLHGGKLGKTVDDMVVSEVNEIISDYAMKVLSPSENAKRMARALMIEETPANIIKLIKEIPAFGAKQSTNIDTVIRIGKTSKIGAVERMTNYMVTRQRAVAKSLQVGTQADGTFLEGVILGLQRSVDKIENMRVRVAIDRYWIKPFAEANLGSVAYPIWNVFEGVAVHMIEGVIPGFVKQEAYNIMVKGLSSDPGLALRIVAEPVSLVGATATRRAGAITFLPQGKILGWMGRNWIGLSNVAGDAMRRNFVTRKMSQYLMERAFKESGGDLMLALSKFSKGAPRISKQTLGLSTHELEQEMFRRLSASVEDVLALKTILTDGSLMKGEALKILRKAEYLSPRAKMVGEELVQRGKALVDVEDFVKQVSEVAVEDLRRYPFEVSDSFRYVADQIDATPINTSNDLMEIFTHYETMSETAAFIPHRMMSQTMDSSIAMRKAGQWGKIQELWVKNGDEMLNAMAEVNSSLESVKAKILANGDKLTDKQRLALETVLERSEASNLVRQQTLGADRKFMEDFWALPKAQRTDAAWNEAWAYRDELWNSYQIESAIPSAGEFVTRRNLAKLYHDVPEPKLTPVDATLRELTTQDVANVFGVNIDGLTAGMLDNLSLHGKPYFIQLVKQSAEAKPNLFKGFTELKIGQVYDNIIAQSRLRPNADIAIEKLLAQMEGIKQDMISLKMRHSLTPDEKVALDNWIDNAAAGRSKIIGDVVGAPSIDELGWAKGKLDIMERTGYEPGYLTQKELDRMQDVLEGIGVTTEDILKLGKPTTVEESLRNIGLYRARVERAIRAGPPAKKALITQADWDNLRQLSLDDAMKDYYKSFADYTNETIVGGAMKMIYPYWTYHTYRWFYLSRTALRHPGIATAWGKYNNYGENGYIPTWFPNIEMNPFTGSVMGTTFTLTRFDFASYYNNLGWAGEMLDYSMRIGYFPNAAVMAPIALTPYLSGRPAELSDIAPPIFRSGINLLVASKIPGVSQAAQWLKDKVFHENFHDYYTATILSNKQIEAGGKLMIDPTTGEPQSGIDIWFKRRANLELTEEEQKYWDESYREAALIGALRSQFPQFRLRTEEYKEAYKQVTAIIEAHLGISEAEQKELWRQHMRPTDVTGGYSLDLRMALDDLWQWRTMMGRGTILMPPDIQDIKALENKYHDRVKAYQTNRLKTQASIDTGFFHIVELGTKLLDGREWRQEYAGNWSNYATSVDGIKTEPEFKDIEHILSEEGKLEVAKRLGFNIPPDHPLDEAINLYFELELEMKADPITGEEDWDYLGFWLKREAVRMALTDEQREEFDAYVRRYKTPMEQTFRQIYSEYIRGYQATSRIIFNTFEEDEQAIIKEYYATTTIRERREELKEVVRADGLKLISQYESKTSQARLNLRDISPQLDFYLYVFGYTPTTAAKMRTPEAQAMVDKWEQDRTSILVTE